MTSMMRYDDHNIIMHRGLSPRRAAPPTMPGRSKTQYAMNYGGFRKHETSSADPFGGLDLHTYPYSAGHIRNPGYTSYGGARESRPMHRHLRNAKRGEEYVHNHSIYYSTTPNVSGYFIIHPDWVSERLSLRRSQSLLSF